jgi:hypothetical protein
VATKIHRLISYPPPRITARFGSSSKLKASSEVIANSCNREACCVKSFFPWMRQKYDPWLRIQNSKINPQVSDKHVNHGGNRQSQTITQEQETKLQKLLENFTNLSWYVDASRAAASCYQNVLCGIAFLGTILLGNFHCMSINQTACPFDHCHASIRENSLVYSV